MGMRDSLVRRAAEEFKQGRYLAALDLYRKLAERLGERFFHANITLCERMLRGQGQRKVTRNELRETKVACVMDEFTFHCYDPECQLLPLTPGQAIEELQGFEPDLLFIESAWQGKDGLWSRKIGSLSQELRNIVQWCKEHQVPTVFWNKEDPVHFETFLTTAQQFDFVFTTDIDCIARYKAALGHDRVYLLPFACQPKTHNPIELYTRKDAFCFAGAYYVRYPERTRDLETYVAEFPKFKPLEIFDRNFGKEDVNYQFPAEYRPYIVGTLPFNEIDKAYKGYRYSINLNSIKQSQTMFARRVFELLGSNTITVSNFSRGVRLMFGDLVIASDSGKEIVDRLRALDAEGERKLALAGLRKVMQEHTYGHRLAYVVRKALGWRLVDDLPPVVVVAYATSESELKRSLANFESQVYSRKRLIVVSSGSAPIRLDGAESVELLTQEYARETLLSSLLRGDEWLASMDVSDFYGPNYLTDLTLATRYSDAPAFGKVERFQWRDPGICLIEEGRAYCEVDQLYPRSSLIRRAALPVNMSLLRWLERGGTEPLQLRGLAIDPFGYCESGRVSKNLSVVEERVCDWIRSSGVAASEIFGVAESIGPVEYCVENGAAWRSFRLSEAFGEIKHPQVSVVVDDNGVEIKSNLPDGKHEYFYGKNVFEISSISGGSLLETYLDATPGLNVQYVFIFLDHEKNRIGHVICYPNKNQSAPVPGGAVYVKFGWRISGGGRATVISLEWTHRQLAPSRLIGGARSLLVTNHYPSYSDLYKNGFVHSRVKSYSRRGVVVDVFRLRADEVVAFSEFQNIDVTTGGAGALDAMLKDGMYQSVLVHFLSPDMWSVIKKYPELKVVVWVHGAEIQAWHRRSFNFDDEKSLSKARRESDERLRFWGEVLAETRENFKLVFVSKYLAECAFSDIGFRISEDRYVINHNPIDTELFSYERKPRGQRCRILSIRPYASKVYANDLSVEAVRLLSKKPFFKELEFHFLGDGPLFDETLKPLRDFENVKIERRFLTQKDISLLHREYGVFLVPSRMDTQGVSRDEAMASGLVPITNSVAAIPEFVDETCGVLADPESAQGLAEGIERLYQDPELFERLSLAASERVRRLSAASRIVGDEIALFSSDEKYGRFVPVLTYHHHLPQELKERSQFKNGSVTHTVESFEEQMAWLSENGYRSLTLDEFERYLAGRLDIRKEKRVLITFDDGYLSVKEYCYPVLKKYGFTAVVFVITGRQPRFSEKEFKFNQLQYVSVDQMSALGDVFEWAVHTHDMHIVNSDKVSKILTEDVVDVVRDAVKCRDSLMGSTHFCFPFGQYSYRVINALRKEGFKYFYTTERGGVCMAPGEKMHVLKRVSVSPKMSLKRFELLMHTF